MQWFVILLSEMVVAWLHAAYCASTFIDLDEELPDYIMVMVANKKTSQQMAEDLSLFLGNNTIKFTAWYDHCNVAFYCPSCTKQTKQLENNS